ncbi:hypothetical protein U1872_19270 [Sphingomonas sp. RB3P16]|uniref:hypothetical protein n=1 Tax=Parasphingomonas frigoris TaxID=3096163 RepID=UPI002FC64410
MRPSRAPLWLAAPSRFATLTRNQARRVLAALALLLALSLTALVSAGPLTAMHDPADAAREQTDIGLYTSITEAVRHGGNYYAAAAAAQRSSGYPLRPFVTMRLPTLTMVQATLPRFVTLALLYALAAGVLYSWYRTLQPALAGPTPRLIAVLLVACGGLVFARPDLVAFHEIWAGLLIALSLGLWRRDRWIEPVAIATCAMLIRETAALYAIVMALCALYGGQRRETAGWGIGLLAFGVAVLAHAYAWSLVTRPDDAVGLGWSGLLGFGFFFKLTALLTALAALPLWLGAPFAALGLFGWSAWRDPTALRALAVVVAYALLIALFCRADTSYWGLMVAPLSLIGLIFVPDALRDLVAIARDRRRITVTRITP